MFTSWNMDWYDTSHFQQAAASFSSIKNIEEIAKFYCYIDSAVKYTVAFFLVV